MSSKQSAVSNKQSAVSSQQSAVSSQQSAVSCTQKSTSQLALSRKREEGGANLFGKFSEWVWVAADLLTTVDYVLLLLTAAYYWLTHDFILLTVCCLLRVTYYSLLAVYGLRLAADCWPLTACYFPVLCSCDSESNGCFWKASVYSRQPVVAGSG